VSNVLYLDCGCHVAPGLDYEGVFPSIDSLLNKVTV
jgi:hypothetical protein